jgi:hypothetical protein
MTQREQIQAALVELSDVAVVVAYVAQNLDGHLAVSLDCALAGLRAARTELEIAIYPGRHRKSPPTGTAIMTGYEVELPA